MPNMLKTADGLKLATYEWRPDTVEVGVALLHGYGEHAGRYARLAASLNAANIGVFAVDLRGHGRSEGRRGHVRRFWDYHEDVALLLDIAREQTGDKPLVLMGHSMGGLLALDVMQSRNPAGLAGLALSSPYLGLALKVNPVLALAARAASVLAPQMAVPSGLKGCDVTRDAAEARIYDEDPLNNKTATARWFRESGRAIKRVRKRGSDLKLPLWLAYAAADRIASVSATDAFVASLGNPREVLRLSGYFHELFNEPPKAREPVIQSLTTWLLAQKVPLR